MSALRTPNIWRRLLALLFLLAVSPLLLIGVVLGLLAQLGDLLDEHLGPLFYKLPEIAGYLADPDREERQAYAKELRRQRALAELRSAAEEDLKAAAEGEGE